jgi:hypothetical protein
MGTKQKASTKLSTALTYMNTLDLFKVTERFMSEKTAEGTAPKTSYQAILSVCERIRAKHSMRPADATIASMAVDLRSEKQLRFVDALKKMGITVDPIDYRWAYVGSAGNHNDDQDRPPSSLAPQVTYILGLLAGRAEATGVKAEVLVVAGVFDIYRSLLDFVQNRGGKAVLAFPRAMLDHRWAWQGLGTAECAIEYEDLEPDAEEIFGVRLDAQSRLQLPGTGGLASF